jgi:hypothetical protein
MHIRSSPQAVLVILINPLNDYGMDFEGTKDKMLAMSRKLNLAIVTFQFETKS